MSVVTVETTSRRQTWALLRKLQGHDVYAIQVGIAHWLVRNSRPSTAAGVAALEALVAEWARDEGMPLPLVHVSDAAGEIHQ